MTIEVNSVNGPANYFGADQDIERVSDAIKSIHENIAQRNGSVIGHYAINLAQGGEGYHSGEQVLFIVADIPESN